VNRIDAAGLGLLLELREQIEAKAITFKLMNVTKLVQHVLDMTCLSSVFHITSEGEVISTSARNRTGGTFKLIPCAR
jgi:anti-anti-sigma factor